MPKRAHYPAFIVHSHQTPRFWQALRYLEIPVFLPAFSWLHQSALAQFVKRQGRFALGAALVAFWFATGGRIVISSEGRIVVYCPPWFYKLMTLVCWPLNWAITFVTSSCPGLKQNKPGASACASRRLLATAASPFPLVMASRCQTGL